MMTIATRNGRADAFSVTRTGHGSIWKAKALYGALMSLALSACSGAYEPGLPIAELDGSVEAALDAGPLEASVDPGSDADAEASVPRVYECGMIGDDYVCWLAGTRSPGEGC